MDIDPNTFDSSADLAEAMADAGQYTEAIGAYQGALVQTPESAVLYNDLALVYEEIGELEEAESAYKKAIALQPDLYIAYFNLGLLYKERKLPDQAVRCFTKCMYQRKDREIRDDATIEYRALEQVLSAVSEIEDVGQKSAYAPVDSQSTDHELDELALWETTSRSYRRMQGTLRAMGLLTLLVGLFGLVAIFVDSLSSLSLLIIGLTILLLPIRSMFLALAFQSGWIMLESMVLVVLLPGNGAAVFLIPVAIALTIFLAWLFFRNKEVEIRYRELNILGGLGAISREIKAAQFLPWMVFTAGFLSIVSLVLAFVFGIGSVLPLDQVLVFRTDLFEKLALTFTLSYAFGLTGIAIGLSSLVENRQKIAITIVGMICSGIVLAIMAGLIVVGSLVSD